MDGDVGRGEGEAALGCPQWSQSAAKILQIFSFVPAAVQGRVGVGGSGRAGAAGAGMKFNRTESEVVYLGKGCKASALA